MRVRQAGDADLESFTLYVCAHDARMLDAAVASIPLPVFCNTGVDPATNGSGPNGHTLPIRLAALTPSQRLENDFGVCQRPGARVPSP